MFKYPASHKMSAHSTGIPTKAKICINGVFLCHTFLLLLLMGKKKNVSQELHEISHSGCAFKVEIPMSDHSILMRVKC